MRYDIDFGEIMQLYLPAAAKTPGGFTYPHHFARLVDYFGGAEWISDLAAVTPGAWAIVMRAPSAFSLGRVSARAKGGGCFIFEHLTSDERSALVERDGVLLIDLGWEVLFPRAEIVSDLIAALVEFDLDPRRVKILHSNQVARAAFERHWREQTDIPPVASLEFPTAMALCVVYQQSRRDDAAIDARRERAMQATRDNKRSRLFVCFNGEVRPHRLYVAAALYERGLIDRGYLSLLSQRKGRPNEARDEFSENAVRAMKKYSGGAPLESAARAILAELPFRLDIGAIPSAQLEQTAWESQSPEYYDDSRFSVVIDTSVGDENVLFVTEKVLKPLMNFSPFIFMGNLGSAALLRGYGFQTFEPYFGQPEVDVSRDILAAGVEEIGRLASLGEAQLDGLSLGLADVCGHNAEHFWNGFPKRLRADFMRDVLGSLSVDSGRVDRLVA
jgi:hypothetical protein